ncbi:alpha/beta hydrolase [Mycetocola zhujimingii]|uniref:Alpha/beta hydrolase n=1 Tax=Mycetocola zhujimingii TaxID=2079792 RepID=A0A2U1TH92_9MICO|nr:alpha/beta hydrolase [Mycetocola zhujimingii]PWC08267.1 alpha/beta hydrolase [Mycetocola zhujimingii]
MHTVASLSFSSSGALCRGTLLLPESEAPPPVVLLCTGFGGTQDTPAIRAAAEAFADAGFAALSFDYRSFGVSDGEPRQVMDIDGQLSDIRAAMDYITNDLRLDASRIVLWGTSLGGGHVVTSAADRDDVVAVIAQVPYNGFPRRVEGRTLRGTLSMLLAIVRDRLRGRFGRPPAYIPLVGPTGSLAVMASDGATTAIDALDSPTWRNEVAPRDLFTMTKYHPGDYANRIAAPLLVCAAVGDRESPLDQVRELADRAPHGRQIDYDVAHYDVYRPEIRARLLADQVRFLEEVV